MSKFTFLDLAVEVLKNSTTALDVGNIWAIAEKCDLVKKLGSTGKTPWASLGARLYVDVKENQASIFFKYGKNPALFGLRGVHEPTVLDLTLPVEKKEVSIKERNLHSLLAFFAKFYLDDVFVKTIFHERSTKKSFNEWLHPDLVGVRFPDLDRSALQFATSVGKMPLKLLAFELKVKLDFSNLRESFFQAVSNSSWANQGYLAATNIKQDTDFLMELKRLSSSFGIGVISLDARNPDDSVVLFSAAERENLDWDTLNKLAIENPDFRQFLADVQIDLQGGKVHPAEYDFVEEDPAALALLIEKSKR